MQRFAFAALPTLYVCVLATIALAQESAPPGFSAWKKTCIGLLGGGAVCLIGSSARVKCQSSEFAAALMERDDGTDRRLLAVVPSATMAQQAIGLVIDDGETMVAQPVGRCSPNCTVEYPADVNLIDRLKNGHTLIFKQLGAEERVITQLPLAGFAAAYDGSRHEPEVFEEVCKKIEAK